MAQAKVNFVLYRDISNYVKCFYTPLQKHSTVLTTRRGGGRNLQYLPQDELS